MTSLFCFEDLGLMVLEPPPALLICVCCEANILAYGRECLGALEAGESLNILWKRAAYGYYSGKMGIEDWIDCVQVGLMCQLPLSLQK